MCVDVLFSLHILLFISGWWKQNDYETFSLEMKIIFSYLDFGWWTLQVFMKSFSIAGIVLGKATITSDELIY